MQHKGYIYHDLVGCECKFNSRFVFIVWMMRYLIMPANYWLIIQRIDIIIVPLICFL